MIRRLAHSHYNILLKRVVTQKLKSKENETEEERRIRKEKERRKETEEERAARKEREKGERRKETEEMFE